MWVCVVSAGLGRIVCILKKFWGSPTPFCGFFHAIWGFWRTEVKDAPLALLCRRRSLGLHCLFQNNCISHSGSAPTTLCEAVDEAIHEIRPSRVPGTALVLWSFSTYTMNSWENLLSWFIRRSHVTTSWKREEFFIWKISKHVGTCVVIASLRYKSLKVAPQCG